MFLSPIEVIDLGLLRILQSGIPLSNIGKGKFLFFLPAWIARGNPLFNNNLSYLLKWEGIPPMGNMMNQWIRSPLGHWFIKTRFHQISSIMMGNIIII